MLSDKIAYGILIGMCLNMVFIGISVAQETPEGIVVELSSAPESIGPSSSGIYIYNVTNVGEEREVEVSLLDQPDYIDATIIPDNFTIGEGDTIKVYIYVDTSADAPVDTIELDLLIEDVNDRAVSVQEIFSVTIRQTIDFGMVPSGFEPGADPSLFTTEDYEYIQTLGYDRVYTMYETDYIAVKPHESEPDNSEFVTSSMLKVINYGNVPINFRVSADVDGGLSMRDSFTEWEHGTFVTFDDTEGILGGDYSTSTYNRVGDADYASRGPLDTGVTELPDQINEGDSTYYEDTSDGLSINPMDAVNANLYLHSQNLLQEKPDGGVADLSEIGKLSSAILSGVAPGSLTYAGQTDDIWDVNYGGNPNDPLPDVSEDQTSGSGVFDNHYPSGQGLDYFFDNYDDDYANQDTILPGQSLSMTISIMHMLYDQTLDLYDQLPATGTAIIPVVVQCIATNIGTNNVREILINFVLYREEPEIESKVDVYTSFGIEAVSAKQVVVENIQQTATFTLNVFCQGIDRNGDGKLTLHLKCLGLYVLDIDDNRKDLEQIYDSDHPLSGKIVGNSYEAYNGWMVYSNAPTEMEFLDVNGDTFINSAKEIEVYVRAPASAEGGDKFVFSVVCSPLGQGTTENTDFASGGQINTWLHEAIGQYYLGTRSLADYVPSILGTKTYTSSASASEDGFIQSRTEEVGDTLIQTIQTIAIIGAIVFVILVVVIILLMARSKKRLENMIRK